MKPCSPVIPGEDFEELIIAKDQPEYMPLPVIPFQSGIILSRWEMDEAERKAVAVSGEIYVYLLTFGSRVPEINFQIDSPMALENETALFPTEKPKTVYGGLELPVLEQSESGVWLLLKLTDEDRLTLAAEGNIYFFLHTYGKPITPSLLQVEKPDIDAFNIEFLTCSRYSEQVEKLAEDFNIETFRADCSICAHACMVSVKLRETIEAKGLKIICKICAEDSPNGFVFCRKLLTK